MSAEETPMTTASILEWVLDPKQPLGWEKFAVRYGERIKAWGMRHGLKSLDAEDVSQSILLKMPKKIRGYDPDLGRLSHWLKTVTHNATIDWLRSCKKRQVVELINDAIACEDLEKELEELANAEILLIAMNQVKKETSGRDWAIFEQMTFHRRKAADLAREYKMGISAVHMAKHRVMRKLKAKLRELYGEDIEPGFSND